MKYLPSSWYNARQEGEPLQKQKKKEDEAEARGREIGKFSAEQQQQQQLSRETANKFAHPTSSKGGGQVYWNMNLLIYGS